MFGTGENMGGIPSWSMVMLNGMLLTSDEDRSKYFRRFCRSADEGTSQ